MIDSADSVARIGCEYHPARTRSSVVEIGYRETRFGAIINVTAIVHITIYHWWTHTLRCRNSALVLCACEVSAQSSLSFAKFGIRAWHRYGYFDLSGARAARQVDGRPLNMSGSMADSARMNSGIVKNT